MQAIETKSMNHITLPKSSQPVKCLWGRNKHVGWIKLSAEITQAARERWQADGWEVVVSVIHPEA